MREPVRIHQAAVRTPIGEMIAGATDTHLVMFEFERRRMYSTQLERVRAAIGGEFATGTNHVVDQLRSELDEYFGGRRRDFTVPLLAPGTAFQMRVWDALRGIACGETTTYARLAERIGSPTAIRAVARANGDNRIAILIPCHRVVGSDGTLVGYGGGIARKRQLLRLEAKLLTLPLFPAPPA